MMKKRVIAAWSILCLLLLITPDILLFSVCAWDTGILLDVDFDAVSYIPDKLAASAAECTIKDGYLEISPSYANQGYTLNNAIPTCDREYKIEFDFKIPVKSTAGYQLMLTEKKTEIGADTYSQFGLLGVSEDNHFMIAGKKTDGVLLDEDKWYSYRLVFKPRTTETELKISEKDRPDNTAVFIGTVGTTEYYGKGMPKRAYDTLNFTYTGTLLIDNIKVEECRDKALTVNVTSAHVGNIFDGDDEKKIRVTMENVLAEDVDARILYTVYDEDGNTADNGEIGDFSFIKHEEKTYEKKLNITKYGVYKIVFDIYANNKFYKTVGYDLSVVNKRDDGEALNSRAAVNIPYIYDLVSWGNYKEIITQAGISGVRKDLIWYDVESSDGELSAPEYTCYYSDAVDSGIENMVILNVSNPNYSGRDWNNARPDQIGSEVAYTAWENYVSYVSANLKDGISYYEIINEPNWSISAEVYADYLKRAYRIIKANDPNSVVAGLATGSMPWEWIERVLNIIKSNPNEYLDVITVHPYDFDSGDHQSTTYIMDWSIAIRDRIYTDKIAKLKSLMSKYNCADIPVQITEMAITSTPGVCSVKTQAAELTQLYTVTQAQNTAVKTFWYCLENTVPRGAETVVPMNTEGNFGMVGNQDDTVPLAAKPAYVAMAGFNKMIGNSEYADSAQIDTAKAYRFRRADGGQVIVMWAEESCENVSLNLGCSEVEIFDNYTNSMGTMRSADGIYSFNAGMEPIYIVGNFSCFQTESPAVSLNTARLNMSFGDTGIINISDKMERNLDVIAEGSPMLEAAENCGVMSGEGRIAVKALNIEEEEPLDIKIYDSGNLIYYGRVYVMAQKIEISKLYTDGDEVTGYLKAEHGETLLNVDYDVNKPRLELYDTLVSDEVYEKSVNGNAYMTVSGGVNGGYVNRGYSLNKAIPKDGGYYRVKFDFKNIAKGFSYIVGLAQKDQMSSADVYNQFGLLRVMDNDKFKVAGVELDGMSYEADTWYSYELVFHRTNRNFLVTIQSRNNPEQKAEASGILSTGTYSNGMYEDRVYDCIKFYFGGMISIDNIKVEKTVPVETDIIAENLKDDTNNIRILTAFHDADGTLCGVENISAQIKGRGINRVKLNLNIPAECETLKLLSWDDRMKPYCSSLKFYNSRK